MPVSSGTLIPVKLIYLAKDFKETFNFAFFEISDGKIVRLHKMKVYNKLRFDLQEYLQKDLLMFSSISDDNILKFDAKTIKFINSKYY